MRGKIAGLWALLMLCLSPFACAEDMQFVDAEGFSGYYVDVSSIVIGPEGGVPEGTAPEDIIDAQVAVVKADRNRRYLYRMRFDRHQETYEIFSSEMQAYDTKEVLERNSVGRRPCRYGIASPLHKIVAYINEWKGKQDRANRKSY